MRGAAASLLSLTFAVILGFAECRPDAVARLEPERGRAARPRSRGAAVGVAGAAHGRWQRPDRWLPASLSQAGDDGLGPGLEQRSRQDPSSQRQGGGLKARVVPRSKEPSGRGRMVG
ncbi:hypothetical protein AAES_62502 [Amazona aestiva]|uniref:Uncharacterized protein n=1 Tax=Amazona aestiva TaxID=12930 RepID=A0A0Q3MLZ6_AMAAE|nr:hypothetical protein AAES_62502 [Amazona aestiva]